VTFEVEGLDAHGEDYKVEKRMRKCSNYTGMTSMSKWKDLPYQILRYCCEFSSAKELCALSATSKRLKEIAERVKSNPPSVFTTVVLGYGKLDGSEREQFLYNFLKEQKNRFLLMAKDVSKGSNEDFGGIHDVKQFREILMDILVGILRLSRGINEQIGFNLLEAEQMAFAIRQLMRSSSCGRQLSNDEKSKHLGAISKELSISPDQLSRPYHQDRVLIRLSCLGFPEIVNEIYDKVFEAISLSVKYKYKEAFYQLVQCLCIKVPKHARWVDDILNLFNPGRIELEEEWRNFFHTKMLVMGSKGHYGEHYHELKLPDLLYKLIQKQNNLIGNTISKFAMTWPRRL